MIPDVELDFQNALQNKTDLYVPEDKLLIEWITATLVKADYKKPEAVISIRVVDADEIAELNRKYRKIDKPTNVLSFPYEALPGVEVDLLGDVVICAAVVEAEALEQSKTVEQHWTHIVIHGVLHLLGYDHVEEQQAEKMESLEIDILSNLGIPNPYGELNIP
ncbi:rRNA maturation RNase YbeY [Kaarinaea lacus]